MKDQEKKDITGWEELREDFEKFLSEKRVDTQSEFPSHNSLSSILDRFTQFLVSSIAQELEDVLEAGLGAKARVTMADYLRIQNLISNAKKGKL